MRKSKCFVLIFILMFSAKAVQAQPCISSFPYIENFEANDGGWVAGGIASDWAWGTPAKPVITGAGGGNNCWITGGLINSSYNLSERSTLTSPCFDFTGLQYPRIEFKIFWETERKFDGAKLQFSTNGGISWSDVGNMATAANACLSQNWYNNASINYLSAKPGWSGNIQNNSGSCLGGQGSSTWLVAWHDIKFLAGEANVRFRFDFGAGSSCNNYDGFALDDIKIGEWPPNTASFDFTCKPSRTVEFLSNANCTNGYFWNFGDPASGAANFDNTPNPVHIFSAPGTYTVSLTANFQGGHPATITKSISVIDVAIQTIHAVSCAGNDGSIIANVTGSNGPFTFQWNTNPVQTSASIQNLSAGTYSVTVASPNTCSAEATTNLVAQSPIQLSITKVNSICSNNNGSISVTASGGAGNYIYLWNTGETTESINNLVPGSYNISVTDGLGCTKDSSGILVENTTHNLKLQVQVTDAQCNANNGSIGIMVTGGMPLYKVEWSNGFIGTNITNLPPGTYNAHVSDASGCIKDTSGIIVYKISTVLNLHLGNDTTICNGQTFSLSPGIFDQYLWQDGSRASTFSVNKPGLYSIRVTNASGCIATDSIQISFTDCKDIYFPSAFSPNADGLNDTFGPIGTATALLKNYSLNVYNRYGQVVFSSFNPGIKWNGRYKNDLQNTQVFIWVAQYSLLGKMETKKGTVLLLR